MASLRKLTAILLAAGASNRFGGPKLLHPLSDGTPVAVQSALALTRVLPHTVVVVRPDDVALTDAFTELGLDVVINPAARTGMASSLVAGVRASRDSDGWLIALADMPWVRPETINQLATQLLLGASMVAPVYQGQRGNPVGFSSQWFDALSALRGDRGARELLRQHPNELVLLGTEDPGVLKDVDYPDDLQSRM